MTDDPAAIPIAQLTYQHPPRRNRRGALIAALVASALFAVCIVIVSVLPSLKRTRDYAGPVACNGNLSRIGHAIALYANAHRGRFPDNLTSLVSAGSLDPADLICPCTSLTPATGPTTQAIVADLSAGGHVSYTYIGKGLTYRATSDVVVAYEAPVDHGGGRGMNVLFADGHAEMFHGARGDRLYAKLQSGHTVLQADDWK
jgi:prepilin-type processing-associated H-X9-DG protein